jgi:hypothetical protein
VDKHFVARIKDLILDSLLSARDQMNPNNREKQFELFGFDFLIDEDFRVWLIEANCNPYLAESNEYVAEIL